MSDSKNKKTKIAKIKRTAAIIIIAVLCVMYVWLRLQEQAEYPVSPAQQGTENSVPEYTPIPYVLLGDSGEKRYDANGNLIDTSDFLASVNRASDVLPKGFSLDMVGDYCGVPVVAVNNGIPFFTPAEIELAGKGYFEYYGDLDSLGRCTVAFGCYGRETMPGREKRGSISSIHPTGWKQKRYDCVDSETVMTRAHLAGYMLSTENANEQNLITGTRYMNSDTMLPYEELVADYLDKGSRHVLYRVTPYFKGNDLMARGILMEARSVEDNGSGVCYCVFVYNVQPGVYFNYATGYSEYSGMFFDTTSDSVVTTGIRLKNYCLDASSFTVHVPSCSVCSSLPSGSKISFSGDSSMKNKWGSMGYSLCSCIK